MDPDARPTPQAGADAARGSSGALVAAAAAAVPGEKRLKNRRSEDQRPAPGRAARWAWMMFDWAAQPYHTLVITFVFGPYFVSAVATDPVRGQQMWGLAVGLGGMAIAILAPLMGAMADATGPRKPWVALYSLMYVLGAWLLWFAAPGMAEPGWVLAAFVIGLIGVEFATVFTNAMLPDLAPPQEVGRLSGYGWALGYVGGVVSLAIMLTLLAENDAGVTLLGTAPAFGLDAEAREGTRMVGPVTALWYAIFAAPLFLFVPDAARKGPWRGAAGRGLRELRASVVGLRDRPSLAWFLGASMIYRDALNGFYAFGGVYAAGALGWSVVQIGIFGILAAAVGAVGAWLGGQADAAFGPRPVVRATLWVLLGATLVGVSVSREAVLFVVPVGAGSGLPDLIFYISGALVGAAGGAMQAASRTLLVRQADPARMTAAFGLYALAGKATSFAAPLLVAAVTALSASQQAGVVPVALMFAAGIWALGRVSDATGREAQA